VEAVPFLAEKFKILRMHDVCVCVCICELFEVNMSYCHKILDVGHISCMWECKRERQSHGKRQSAWDISDV